MTTISNNKDIFADSKIITEIPPWALPQEEITLYVKVKKNLKISKIIIQMPECFEIKDFINVEKFKQYKNQIHVLRMGNLPFSNYDYFGVTAATKKPFNDLAVESKIFITLIESDNTTTRVETYARIFRPLLVIDKIPEQISLNDVEETTLPIHLKFKGFGDISIRIEGNIGGTLVSEGGVSVIDRLFHGFLREGIFDAELGKNNDRGIEINKTELVRAFDDFKIKLKDTEYMKNLENDKDITKEAIEWLKSFEEREQEKFMNVLYGTMEGYMIKKITDIFERHVSRHLQLDSGTNIIAEIKTKLTNLQIRIFYRDLAGNIYSPLETTVEIMDKREMDNELRVTIPIDIEHVDESEAYKDVRVMNIHNVA